MKALKIILSVVLCVAVLATTVIAYVNNYTQNNSGRYSSVTTITDFERDWIIKHFGREYESIEEYITTVQNYANKHFIYDYNKKVFFQYFEFDDIVDGDIINGICFDFAVLFKHITLVLSEEKMLPENEIKVYVTDIRYKKKFTTAHSYNVLTLKNGVNYYLDLTETATRGMKGLEPKVYYEKFDTTIKDYANGYGEILFNIH